VYDVFLSYNRQQKAWVRKLYEILCNSGLSVFFDEENIEPGANVGKAIEDALEDSKQVILVLSPSSIDSEWVSMESAMTMHTDPAALAKRLVPIMLEKVSVKDIPPALRFRNFIDLTDPSTKDREFSRLLKHLGVSLDVTLAVPAWDEPPAPSKCSVSSFLTIADIDDVISWGWDGNKLLDELIKLDYQTIDQLTQEHEGEIAQWAPVFMDHPDTWRLLTAGPEKIVGYWHFVPLFSSEFDLAMSGRLKDSQITTDLVRVLELPGWYDIYFVSICAQPLYRRTTRMRPLFRSFFDVVLDLGLEGVRIRRVCTNAYTRSGEALCKDLGFRLEQKHSEKGNIYSLEFSDLLNHDLCSRHPELLELYGVKREVGHLKAI
jgi:hypothetical protein